MLPIVLVTDFGIVDAYVGQMKGVLLRDAPGAPVIDLTHDVTPHQPVEAGFFLEASRRHFPKRTVFAAVVDPGVGSKRRILAMEIEEQYFIAPDNGLLSLVLEYSRRPSVITQLAPEQFLSRDRVVSGVFHGRDVFAPAAALISGGVTLNKLGPFLEYEKVLRLQWMIPEAHDNGVDMRVLHIDRFGNVALNGPIIPWRDTIRKWPGARLSRPVSAPLTPAAAFWELKPGEFGLLPGSQGFVELALNQASASEKLGLSLGDRVTISPPY